jgi:hypothetical protein
VVLSGSPNLAVGTGGIAAIYTGDIIGSTGLASTIGAKATHYSLYNQSSAGLASSGAGYYVLYRQAGLLIYVLPASSQSSEYGTAPVLNYWYSSSPSAVVPVSYAGIPATAQTYSLRSAALRSPVRQVFRRAVWWQPATQGPMH